jgi:hypothetical protein
VSWRYDAERLVLELHDEAGRWLYEVDLERCRTSAEVLDWIFQVTKKRWATDAVIGGLVRELERLFDPQSTLCTAGKDRGPLDVKALLTERHPG